jgi:hypothetical protein
MEEDSAGREYKQRPACDQDPQARRLVTIFIFPLCTTRGRFVL